jgi:hypothetical protein
LQLKWMLEQNRPKDQKKIKIIEDYLDKKWFVTDTQTTIIVLCIGTCF